MIKNSILLRSGGDSTVLLECVLARKYVLAGCRKESNTKKRNRTLKKVTGYFDYCFMHIKKYVTVFCILNIIKSMHTLIY